ncbi:hypothetical protein JCM10908_006088 [Rhodotorula pacifica]|uniref:3'-5' exonuclease n=1 Tax=Rhodotorula pacifica TaxID=1495444 RepID=UPI00317AF1C3
MHNPSSSSSRQIGQQSSPVSWMPKSWNTASSAPTSIGLRSSSSGENRSLPASTVTPVPRLTQEDLDLLVEGIDFDDDFGCEFEKPLDTSPLRPSRQQPPTLAQEELDALVAGIDFTQDIEIDEEDAPRTPARSTSESPVSTLGTLSRTSSLLDILNQQSPAQVLASGLRRYSTVPAIDLCSSSPIAPESRATGANETEQSDEEVVIVSRTRPKAAPTAATSAASLTATQSEPVVPGFFARPPNLRDAAPTARAASPVPETVSRPTDSRALARQKRDSKASDHAERQAQFRRRWPRTFSYKSWNKDVRLVHTSNEAVVEEELMKMTGPLGFDLEWDSFSGYRTQGKTALAQVCDEQTILLVHIAKMKRFPPALQKLAEDPSRIKLGVQIAGDASKLQRDFSIRSQGTLDINAVVHYYDPSRYVGRQRKGLIGLQELTGLYLDQFLRKETTVRTSRWSAALGAQQMEYAANDVYASVQVVRQIQALASVPQDRIDEELVELSRRPFNHWTGFASATVPPPPRHMSRTPLAGNQQAAAPPPAGPAPTTPEQVLSQRKLEAFSLFHRHELPLSEITTRMSATRPVKPVTVVWNLLGAYAGLEQHDIEIPWDISRLVAAMDEIGVWPERMLQEHGELGGALRLRAHSVGKGSAEAVE